MTQNELISAQLANLTQGLHEVAVVVRKFLDLPTISPTLKVQMELDAVMGRFHGKLAQLQAEVDAQGAPPAIIASVHGARPVRF